MMNHALAGAALQFGRGFRESFFRCILVAGRDRGLNFLDKGSHAAEARAIHVGAPRGLSNTFLCRWMIGHCRPVCVSEERGLITTKRAFVKSAVLKRGLALLNERGHPFFLVFSREHRMEKP